jgi:hypothetical protein
MQWKDPEYQADGSVKIPSNWLFIHYYEALNVLFRIENALRTFVFVVLKDNKKSSWAELCIKTEDGSDITIASIAKKRLTQDKAFGYLGYAIPSPLMHLTSGELIRIIFADSYWPMFAEHFPGTKSIVQTKLEEIGNVRNALAHFRPITTDDVQVVKQNANQVLSAVQRLLVDLINCRDTVPTNSTDAWYNELKNLSWPYLQFAFNQSVDEKWVRIGLKYDCPLIKDPYLSDTYRSYRALSVNTPRLLLLCPNILENVIFASENVPYVEMPTDGNPDFSKTVGLLFSRKTLVGEYESLKGELQGVLERLTTETDLIREDNLARGELVQSAWASAQREAQNPWMVDTSGPYSPSHENNPPEYWASAPLFGDLFVSNTESFPWMPVGVSNLTLPF